MVGSDEDEYSMRFDDMINDMVNAENDINSPHPGKDNGLKLTLLKQNTMGLTNSDLNKIISSGIALAPIYDTVGAPHAGKGMIFGETKIDQQNKGTGMTRTGRMKSITT